jgi:putative transposase
VTTQQRRAAVTHLRATYPVSDRRACRLVRLARSRWQYRPRRASDAPLAAALREKAAERPRWGYRRLAVLLRREGWAVNLERVLRVYRAEGLRIRKRRPQKLVSAPRVPRPISEAPNAQWALDFITDAFASGRRFRVLSVVDEWTRECLALRADASQPSWKVVAVRDELAAFRGAPRRLIIDNALPWLSSVEWASAAADAPGVRRA